MRAHRIATLVVALIGAAAIGCGGLWLAVGPRGRAADPQLQAAMQTWDGRSFRDYRLMAEDGSCFYDIVVRDGRVNVGIRDSCRTKARSVDGLFAIIGRDGDVSPNCGVSSCPCAAHTRVTAAYHPRLGYPTAIRVLVDLRPNWRSPDSWLLLARSGGRAICGGGGERVINVIGVEPLR